MVDGNAEVSRPTASHGRQVVPFAKNVGSTLGSQCMQPLVEHGPGGAMKYGSQVPKCQWWLRKLNTRFAQLRRLAYFAS